VDNAVEHRYSFNLEVRDVPQVDGAHLSVLIGIVAIQRKIVN
jgi:hypothetical protein